MGLWSDTFGGGNTFEQSVANTFTPSDGTSYVGGSLVDDYDDDTAYQGPNLDGSAGYNINYGKPDDSSDDYAVTSGGSVIGTTAGPEGSEYQGPNTDGSAGYFWDPKYYTTNAKGQITGIDNDAISGEAGFMSDTLLGKALTWLGGANPSSDKMEIYNGNAVYTKSDGTLYTFNAIGLPYEVRLGTDGAIYDNTDYSKLQEISQSDPALAEAISAGAALTEELEKGSINGEMLQELLTESGMTESNEAINTLINDPKKFLDDRKMSLADLVPSMNADAAGTNIDGSKDVFQQGTNPNYTASTVGDVQATVAPDDQPANTYAAKLIGNDIDAPAYMVDAKTGTVSDNAQVDADDFTADMKGLATGTNADGTKNYAGEALNQYATQDISRIIDTSTVAGKLLADKLGEGNYTDSKSTILGQMKIISAEFKDGQGNPKIPTWAQSTARNVQKTIAFKGMTGTAATAALSNAMMESTLGIAEKEASFFQTLTIKNLDNRQEAFINKANTLSKFELSNLDAREAAAIQNAQTFFTLDLKNLDNEQQSEIINKKARVDALFEDQKAVNAQRLFSAEQENDMQKYYDGLIMRANEATALAANEMKRFNAGEINDASEFNAKIENDRDQFYADMQYNIDLSNAKWRQTVVETETEMKFDAASADVKNLLDLSQEGLNRLWDRVDANLDILFKAAENEADRDRAVLVATIQAQASQQASNSGGGLFGFLGTIAGGIAGSLDWTSILGISDTALKENIRKTGTAKNGLGLYEWDWTEEGSKIAKGQRTKGYLAQEVARKYPQAVKVGEDGHLRINYRKLPQ